MRRLLVAALFVAGCFNPHYDNPTCGPAGECPSGLTCVGTVCLSQAPNDAPPGSGDTQCTTAAVCSNAMTLSDCNGNHACSQGCGDSPTPHCKQIVPSNSVDYSILNGTTDFATSAPLVTINTDDGSIMAGTTEIRPAGVGLMAGIYYGKASTTTAVFAFQSFAIMPTVTISVVGARAIILVVRDTAQIDGVVMLHGAGGLEVPGPGGGVGGNGMVLAGGCGAGSAGVPAGTDSGGGGGGLGSGGGPGGPPDGGVPAPGGGTCGSATLQPLVGGSGGGKGSGPLGGVGGGGGGATQIVALGSISVNGVIDAGGRGGGGGASDDAAGGGGSGGGILLEAPSVTIGGTGRIVANGGGGGGGTFDGMDGQQSSTAAAGGKSGPCTGGNGGAGTIAAQPGTSSCAFPLGTSGGGGGVGRIRLNAVSTPTVMAGSTISPPATMGTAAVQ